MNHLICQKSKDDNDESGKTRINQLLQLLLIDFLSLGPAVEWIVSGLQLTEGVSD